MRPSNRAHTCIVRWELAMKNRLKVYLTVAVLIVAFAYSTSLFVSLSVWSQAFDFSNDAQKMHP